MDPNENNPAPAVPEPTAPATPAEPVATAAEPVAPAESVTPVAPAEPAAEPTVATEPVAPLEPATPVEQTVPTEPIQPEGPAVPATAAPAETPAATPAGSPAPAPTSTQPENPADNPVVPDSTVEPAKKSKSKIIAIAAAGIVLVGGATVAAITISSNNNPEKVALEAATKLVSSKSTSVTGTIELKRSTMLDNEDSVTYVKPGSDQPFFYDTVTIELDAAKDGLPFKTEAKMKLKSSTLNGYDIEFSLGEAMVSDGTVYIKLEGLQALYDKFAALFSMSEYKMIVDKVGEIISDVEGTWWRISIPEIAESTYGSILSTSDVEKVKSVYDCAVSTANKALSDTDTISKFYKNHPFINIEKSDTKINSFTGDIYSMSLKPKELAGFINEGITSSYASEIQSCVKEINPNMSELEAIPEDKIDDDMLSNLPNMFVDIKDRTIQGFYINHTNGAFDIKADLRINYDQKAITAPDNSKSYEELMTKIQSIFGTSYTTDCDLDNSNCEIDYDLDFEEI